MNELARALAGVIPQAPAEAQKAAPEGASETAR
jgi:hypothetical protein